MSQNRLWLLLWKNFKLKLRHPWISLMELGLPCLLTIILVVVRVMVHYDWEPERFYNPQPIESTVLSGKTVLYVPANNQTDDLMEWLRVLTVKDLASPIRTKGFDTEQELVDYYLKTDSTLMLGVVFNSIENGLDFKLRLSFATNGLDSDFSFDQIDEFTWKTSQNFPLFQKPGPRNLAGTTGGPPGYYQTGFLYLQHYVTRAYAFYRDPDRSGEFYRHLTLNVQRFPYPAYANDQFLFSLQFMFPLILMISFIYPFVNLTKNIVLEKELRLREVMRMMGLSEFVYWTSWFIDALLWNTVTIIIITALFCVEFKPGYGILTHSNFVLVFLFFLFHFIASIMFCFFVSTLFTNANIAGIMSGTFYFISFIPYFTVSQNYHELSTITKTGIGLIFNTNMGLGCMLLSIWESNHIGLQWSNVMEPANLDDSLSFIHILAMFAIDALIYLLAALYISNVFPGRYGVPRPWYYFVQPSYWFGSSKSVKPSDDLELNDKDKKPTGGSGGVRLANLSKSYNGGKIEALKQMNLTMNENEITVLLGHNGAGKTTLMSILCGLLPATSGSIYIDGHQVTNQQNQDRLRQSLGVCPQFDVLFNHLTVAEHLWFYCKLKKIDNAKIAGQIDRMVGLLDFADKRHQQAHTLSGGQKRKLSVGIALIGDSRIVLLDEATSGMDVSARRFIWDLLIREKKNRTILLSTHFMEEADVLGDQIAIIETGQLKCFGSPLELKKRFGLGYLLTFSVLEDRIDVNRLVMMIKSYVHHAKLLTSIGREITFSLPENQSHQFEAMFAVIERQQESLGILNYGISVTTLEEVFLRVGDFAKQGTEQMNSFYEIKPDVKAKPDPGESNGVSIKDAPVMKPETLKFNTGISHLGQIYSSLLMKKIIFTFRNLFSLLAQFIIPAALLAAAIWTNKNQMNQYTVSPPLRLSLDSFHKFKATLFVDESDPLQLAHPLADNYHRAVSNTTATALVNRIDGIPHLNIGDYAQKYLVQNGTAHEDEYNLYYLLAATFSYQEYSTENSNYTEIVAWFNNQAYHTSAISLALVDQAILAQLFGRNAETNLIVWNDPLPRKHSDMFSAVGFDGTMQVQLSNNVQFAISFLMASFVIFLVKENRSNFKHIQRISGLHLFHYWATNFVLDFFICLLSAAVMSGTIYGMDVRGFETPTQIGYLMAVFAGHACASLPMVYLFSLYFHDAATAYVRLSLYLLILGSTSFLVVVILQIPQLDLMDLSRIMTAVFTFLLPIFSLAFGVFSLMQNHDGLEMCLGNITFLNQTFSIQNLCQFDFKDMPAALRVCCPGKCGDLCMPFAEDQWQWSRPGIGRIMAGFLVQTVAFWLLLTLVEGQILRRIRFNRAKVPAATNTAEPDSTDSDVEEEADRLRRRNSFNLARTDSMVVQNVYKYYGKFPAVRGISFGVKKGECFGVLGENGAGKTTLFKMITGQETITNGAIYINNRNIQSNMAAVYKDIGYCPQFDGLIDHLTGRETLATVCRIRGIQERFIDRQIDLLSDMLFFRKHIDQTVGGYSGGTKRKLSFAISIVGNPLIVFLDEPTTGVDPVSRRCLWNAIHQVRSAGSSLVLTSHSMEECEALCNRLIIMVHGRLMCFGSTMHLKQKFGAGYIVLIKLKPSMATETDQSSPVSRLDDFMRTNFSRCQLDSVHNHSITYRIETNQIKLSQLFGQIERAKDELQIEDYSICQTSLERIFLSFVRDDKKPLLPPPDVVTG